MKLGFSAHSNSTSWLTTEQNKWEAQNKGEFEYWSHVEDFPGMLDTISTFKIEA
jgi:hypothetical protein